MRLAITFPYTLGTPGGGTRDCLQLAWHLGQAGIEVIVIPVLSGGHTHFPRPKIPLEAHGQEQTAWLAEVGVEVRPVQPNPFHYLLEGLAVKRAVQALHAEKPLDAVLGYTFEMMFLGSFLRREGIAYGINAAGSYRRDFFDLGRGPKAWLKRWKAGKTLAQPMRDADVVLARSAFTRQEVIEVTGVRPERVEVVHLGVESDLSDLPRELEASIERLLFFGSFRKEKGLDDALIALGLLAAENPAPWTLRVAGWGDIEAFGARARELGIGERIEFVGPLARAELREALGWAQVVIMPSHGESFGLANAEAQTAGLPVIAFDVAAVPEVVAAGETGWLPPLGDHAALAAAIGEALADPAETHKRGMAGRKRMLEGFSWQQTALKTQRALELQVSRLEGQNAAQPADAQSKR